MVIKESNGGETMANSKTTDTEKSTSSKTSIIAQEIKFARALAGNDPKLRRKVLKNLKAWLTTRSQSTFAFSDADFLRLWKGLFYCMWMSDKPLVQEELAESIASLVRCFEQNVPVAMQFFHSFLVTMGLEWFGIDRWRMDKFMMFVRRVTRQTLFVLHGNEWNTEHVALLVKIIDSTILDRDVCPFGLTNHFNDLLLEEIAKVSDGTVPKEIVTQLVEPYVQFVLKNDDTTVNNGVVKNIFHALMQQSELGQMYQEKFDLWKRTNFVTGDIDSVQFDVKYKYGDETDSDEEEEDQVEQNGAPVEQNGWKEDEAKEGSDDAAEDDQQEADEAHGEDEKEEEEESDEEGTEKVYDPRAGRVSVEIPQIEFDPLEIASLFEKYRFKSFTTSRGKQSAVVLVRQLKKFASGAYPLGIKHVPSISPKHYAVDIDEQVHELEDFRKQLYGDNKSKNFKELKKEKQRLRKLHREQKEAEMAKKAATAQQKQKSSSSSQPNETTVQKVQDENDDNSGAIKKSASKKQKKIRKKSPVLAKKEAKLQLLKQKKQAKLLLLKERLKQMKNNKIPTNGSSDAKERNDQSLSSSSNFATTSSDSPVSAKQSTPSEGKKVSLDTNNKKQQPHTKEKTGSTKNAKPFQTVDEWAEPLKEGEEEYFIPSRKLKTKLNKVSPITATASMKNSGIKSTLKRTQTTPTETASDTDPITPARKRVKIALNKNVAQDLVEHIKQVKSSPQLPFDSSRKPSKSLLKPNLIPSPINPFYKKKIGLK